MAFRYPGHNHFWWFTAQTVSHSMMSLLVKSIFYFGYNRDSFSGFSPILFIKTSILYQSLLFTTIYISMNCTFTKIFPNEIADKIRFEYVRTKFTINVYVSKKGLSHKTPRIHKKMQRQLTSLSSVSTGLHGNVRYAP